MKFIQLLIPFSHIAYECLEILKCKNIHNWPTIQNNIEEKLKLAVQIKWKDQRYNRNKKGLNRGTSQRFVLKFKGKKYIENSKIIKIIFVKKQNLNYIFLVNEAIVYSIIFFILSDVGLKL